MLPNNALYLHARVVRLNSSEPRNLRIILVKVGAALFIASIPVTVIGGVFFGEQGIAWPAVLMINPSLMIIGAAVGFSGIVRVFKDIRAGELFAEGAFSAAYSIGQALVFSLLFFVFLNLEFKAIFSLRQIAQ